MLSINTNLSSIIAQNSMKTSTDKLNQAIERMTTGAKINHAKDNAANYSISTNMTTKIGAYQVAEDNAAMGLDMVTTASENLSLIEDKLNRLRALATQSNNGTYGEKSKSAINAEVNSLVDDIEKAYKTTQYNGVKMFDYETSNTSKRSMQNIEESKKVKNVTSFVSGETYYITDAADLVQLQDLTNSGKSTINVTFELTSDIDMEGVEFVGIGASTNNNLANYFRGIFNGNGYIIKNLKIENSEGGAGLFRTTRQATISDVGVVNCSVSGTSYVAGLVGHATKSTSISNCYVEGKINASGNQNGILVGTLSESISLNCFVKGSIISSAGSNIGGFVGYSSGDSVIKYCYAEADVVGNDMAGGFIGSSFLGVIENCCFKGTLTSAGTYRYANVGGFTGRIASSGKVENCITICKILGVDSTNNGYTGEFAGRNLNGLAFGSNNYYVDLNPDINRSVGDNAVGELGIKESTEEELMSSMNLTNLGFNLSNGWSIKDGKPELVWMLERTKQASQVGLQVGTTSSGSSNIQSDFGLELLGLQELRGIGKNEGDFISIIDNLLLTLSSKQTELGAVQNRLDSVLEEISTQYENLVSSRSTLRDADIAEVSSTYIQQQILKQASATLMATANQSPSIALQLI